MSLPWIPPRQRSVLSRAVARWRAGNYDATLDALRDESGNGLNARLGSAVGADTNDPLRLPFTGKKVYFPGSSGNTISTPNSAAFPTSSHAFVTKIAAADYTPGTAQSLVSKWAAGQRSIAFDIQTTGFLTFYRTSNGNTSIPYSGTTSLTTVATDGADIWLAYDYTQNAGGGNSTVNFYTSTDGINWVQLGATVTVADVTGIFNSTTAVHLGATDAGAGNFFTGSIYYAQFRSSLAGAASFTLDASLLSEPYATHTDAQGNVWTLNRSTSGRKLCVVDRDLLLLGTDDYLEVADSPLLDFASGEAMTAVCAMRRYGGTPAASMGLVVKQSQFSGAAVGWNLQWALDGKIYTDSSDGTNRSLVSNTQPAAGVSALVAAVRSAPSVKAYSNPLSVNATAANISGSLANALPLRIGAHSNVTPGSFFEGEIISAAVFREPLSMADLYRLAREMGVAS